MASGTADYNIQNSTLRSAHSVAGSGFAPQAQAYSIIPALPLFLLYLHQIVVLREHATIL